MTKQHKRELGARASKKKLAERRKRALKKMDRARK